MRRRTRSAVPARPAIPAGSDPAPDIGPCIGSCIGPDIGPDIGPECDRRPGPRRAARSGPGIAAVMRDGPVSGAGALIRSMSPRSGADFEARAG